MNVDDKTILIIDDDSAVRHSLADYLEDLNYRVVTAENGRIGLQVFERKTVDLVLVDLRMPEVDGLEVLSRISKINSEMPLIVVSGTGVIADAVEALHQGAWDYVLKPIEDFSVLRHAIESAFDKARLRRENLHYQRHLEQMVVARTRNWKRPIKTSRISITVYAVLWIPPGNFPGAPTWKHLPSVCWKNSADICPPPAAVFFLKRIMVCVWRIPWIPVMPRNLSPFLFQVVPSFTA